LNKQNLISVAVKMQMCLCVCRVALKEVGAGGEKQLKVIEKKSEVDF
jgi:hypothetical protein